MIQDITTIHTDTRTGAYGDTETITLKQPTAKCYTERSNLYNEQPDRVPRLRRNIYTEVDELYTCIYASAHITDTTKFSDNRVKS